MGRRRFIFSHPELRTHFILTLDQRSHLQLQALQKPLLRHQCIVERLNSVVLKGQPALQIVNAFVYVHQSALSKTKIPGQNQA